MIGYDGSSFATMSKVLHNEIKMWHTEWCFLDAFSSYQYHNSYIEREAIGHHLNDISA
jgi:hypothetical protein